MMKPPLLDVDSDQFAKGFELGILWANLNSFGGIQTATIDASNERFVAVMAAQAGYQIAERTPTADGRLNFVFTVKPDTLQPMMRDTAHPAR